MTQANFNTDNSIGDSLLKIDQIIGSTKKGYEPLIPVSKSTWYEGVASGRFPKPIRLGENSTSVFWRASDIQKLISGEGE